MKQIIALALITSVAITSAAAARDKGGDGGQSGAGDNGSDRSISTIVEADTSRRPIIIILKKRPLKQFCHNAGNVAASDGECGHYSR